MKAPVTDPCPQCGEQLDYDEVDIGVGVMRGNPGCPSCHWTPGPILPNIVILPDEEFGW